MRCTRAASLLLDQPCREHSPVTVIVQLDGEDKDVPVPVRTLGREMRWAARAAAINVGFARVNHGAEDLAPLLAELGKVLKQVLAHKPRAFVSVHGGEVVVDILPVAIAIENLQHNIVSHRHGYA